MSDQTILFYFYPISNNSLFNTRISFPRVILISMQTCDFVNSLSGLHHKNLKQNATNGNIIFKTLSSFRFIKKLISPDEDLKIEVFNVGK